MIDTSHIYTGGAGRHVCLADVAPTAFDPTGTTGIRRSFRAAAQRQLAIVRSLVHQQLVAGDFLRQRDPLQRFTGMEPDSGLRYAEFMRWFETVVQRIVNEGWFQKFVNRAFASGQEAGAKLVGLPVLPQGAAPVLYSEHAAREVAGVGAALIQHVARAVAGHAAHSKPLVTYRAALHAVRTVAAPRFNAFANTTTVRLHNIGRLRAFAASGAVAVGVQAERQRRLQSPTLLLVPPGRGRSRGYRRTPLRTDSLVVDRITRAASQKSRAEMLQELTSSNEAEAILERLGISLQQLEVMSLREVAKIYSTVTQMAVAELEALQASSAVQEISARIGAEIEAERTVSRALEEKTKAQVPFHKREPLPSEIAKIEVAQQRLETAFAGKAVNVLTRGDDLVCFECESISEEGPYSLDEAQGLIPAHPNCRCAFVPAE